MAPTTGHHLQSRTDKSLPHRTVPGYIAPGSTYQRCKQAAAAHLLGPVSQHHPEGQSAVTRAAAPAVHRSPEILSLYVTSSLATCHGAVDALVRPAPP